MLRGSTPIQLSQLDISPIIRANALEQQAAANLASSINNTILEFQQKKIEKEEKAANISAIQNMLDLDKETATALVKNPDLVSLVKQQREQERESELMQMEPIITETPVNIGTPDAPAYRTIVSILNPVSGKMTTEVLEAEDTKQIYKDYSDEQLKETKESGYRPKSLERIQLEDGTFVNRVYGDIEDRFTYDKSILPEDVPETKVQEAQRVVKEYNEAFPDNKIDEAEGVQKLISLYKNDQDIVFDFGSLGRFDEEGGSLGGVVNIGGKNYAVGTVLQQDGVKYELQADGSLTKL
jgi:hypothetical protein|tara:strand:+ start:2349 stop:3236 length:888 start_codon:yes stop_codon:yes gene_type:complete